MICTSVMPCLSSGLAKNDKTASMFVLSSQFFGTFESLPFAENGGQTLGSYHFLAHGGGLVERRKGEQVKIVD